MSLQIRNPLALSDTSPAGCKQVDIIEKAGCVIGVVHRSTELDRYLPFEVGGRGTLTKYDAERAIQPFVLFHLESGPLAGINKILQGLLHILENLFV